MKVEGSLVVYNNAVIVLRAMFLKLFEETSESISASTSGMPTY